MYSSYEFYAATDEKVAEISPSEYCSKAEEAASIIDFRTFGRAAGATGEMADKVKICECKIIDALVSFSSPSAGIASESNDGYSVSYRQDAEQKLQEKILSICREYLTYPENLMYAGCDSW